MRFEKYEGAGNDFVLVDCTEREVALLRERAATICDRHFGVGADGILAILPASSARSAARMVVINADGSIAEMCGNGIRCVAMHVAGRAGASSVCIETDAGPLDCVVEMREGDALVTVDLGPVIVTGVTRVEIDGASIEFATANTGNRHAIRFGQYDEAMVRRIGPVASVHPAFDGGANIEFADIIAEKKSVRVAVWERGVGVTMACGTGAAAVVAALCDRGEMPRDTPIAVELPGGTLIVTMRSSDSHAVQRGPARRVFSGEIA